MHFMTCIGCEDGNVHLDSKDNSSGLVKFCRERELGYVLCANN